MTDKTTVSPAARRAAWLEEMKAGYTGDGINPEGKLAAKNPNSRALAIPARCWQCTGSGAGEPGGVKRIAECAAGDCALHPHRPYQEGGYRANLDELKAGAPALPFKTVVSPIERARANPADRTLAVRAYCYDCMGGQPVGRKNPNGDVRKQVGECTTVSCALWGVRPWKNATPGEIGESCGERAITPDVI